MINSVVMLLMPAITAFSYGAEDITTDMPKLESGRKQIRYLIKSLDSPSVSSRILSANKIGEQNIREAVAHLIAKLKDENPQVRAEVVSSLGKMKIKNISSRVYAMLLHDPSPLVRAKAAVALADLGYKEAKTAMFSLLNRPDIRERLAAIEALGKIGGAKVFSTLVQFLNSPNPEIQEAAIKALGNLNNKRGGQYILRYLDRKNVNNKSVAILVLSKLNPALLRPHLKKLLVEGENQVKIATLKALVFMKYPECKDSVKFLISKANDSVSSVASVVASIMNYRDMRSDIAERLHSNPILNAKLRYLWALAQLGYSGVIKDAVYGLSSPVPEIRLLSINIIRLMRPRDPFVTEKVTPLIHDSEPSVAAQAYMLLAEYGKSSFFTEQHIKNLKENIVKAGVARGVVWLGKPSKQVVSILKSWLSSKNLTLKIEAVRALGRLKDISSVSSLLSMIYSRDYVLKKSVVEALAYIAAPVSKSTLKYIFKTEKDPLIKAYAALGIFKIGINKQTLSRISYEYEKALKYHNKEINLIYSLILYKSRSHLYGKEFIKYFKRYFLSGENTAQKAELLDLITFLDKESESWFIRSEKSDLFRVKSKSLLYLAKFRDIKADFSDKVKIPVPIKKKVEKKDGIKLPFSEINEASDDGCSCSAGKKSSDPSLLIMFVFAALLIRRNFIFRN